MLFRYAAIIATVAATAAAKHIRFEGGEERNLQSGQPSTKFAASWSEDVEIASACMNSENEFNLDFWGNSSLVDIDALCNSAESDTNENMLNLTQISPLGLIKIPQNKEILVTLSSQIDILTVNQATSKKPTDSYWGNIGGTYAFAGVNVKLSAVNTEGDKTTCYPGEITLASRAVELKNVIGGEVTYEDCEIDAGTRTCTNKIADTELSSSIGLAMSTAAAHSFQFLCVNMDSDTYDVYAEFSLSADVENICDAVLGGDCGTIADFAGARVALNKRMLTVQQVRMANQIELD